MDYYISLGSHDLPLSDIAGARLLLVSPTNFPAGFTYAGKRPIDSLYIDSGAYHHNARRTARDQLKAAADQFRILQSFPEAKKVSFFHCDVLPRNGISPDAAVEQTLANAVTFAKLNLGPDISKVGVAQARTPEEMFFVVKFLEELGYKQIALGGLANLHRTRFDLLAPMIEAAAEAGGNTPIHVLGVTAASVLEVLRHSGIASCDSASPIWAAIYGSLLYSAPFRRYRLRSVKSERPGAEQSSSYYRPLKHPLPCPCPVCKKDPLLLAGVNNVAKYYRTVHNYLHLKAEIEGESVWQQVYLSAESLSEFMNLSAFAATSAVKNR